MPRNRCSIGCHRLCTRIEKKGRDGNSGDIRYQRGRDLESLTTEYGKKKKSTKGVGKPPFGGKYKRHLRTGEGKSSKGGGQ